MSFSASISQKFMLGLHSLPFIILLLCFTKTYAQSPGPIITVNTTIGLISGFHADFGSNTSALFYGNGDVFLGIPYAVPPVGERRFQNPIPMGKLMPDGTAYDASYYRAACPQPSACRDSPSSEDCLHLNVYTPDAHSQYKYPVMVWIHGGAFMSGCAKQFHYKGAIRNLVSRGVVVVVIQYRLNVPGYFTTETDDFPANRGMLDQVSNENDETESIPFGQIFAPNLYSPAKHCGISAIDWKDASGGGSRLVEALRWVQTHISAFGGDPYRVTLFGQSAGSISTCAHTYSPLSRGLFQQAIMESGTVLTSTAGALGNFELSFNVANKLCNTTRAQWQAGNFAALKQCMAKAQPQSWMPLERYPPGWEMNAVNNSFLPDYPWNLAYERKNIPTMIGCARDEWASTWLGLVRDGLPFSSFNKTFVEGYFMEFSGFTNGRAQDVWKILKEVYVPAGTSDSDSKSWFISGTKLFTAAGFTGFMQREISHQLEQGNPNLYLWEFTYPSYVTTTYTAPELGDWRPVPHSAELPFIWIDEGNWNNALGKNLVVPFDYTMADWFGEKWTTFAKFGTPTLDSSWKPTSLKKEYYRVDEPSKGGFTMRTPFRKDDEIAFTKVLPALINNPPFWSP